MDSFNTKSIFLSKGLISLSIFSPVLEAEWKYITESYLFISYFIEYGTSIITVDTALFYWLYIYIDTNIIIINIAENIVFIFFPRVLSFPDIISSPNSKSSLFET